MPITLVAHDVAVTVLSSADIRSAAWRRRLGRVAGVHRAV